MAQLTEQLRSEIDWLLSELRDEWEAAIEMVQAWDGLDQVDRSTFLAEWSTARDDLLTLQSYAQRGLMTPEQVRGFADLCEFMRSNAPYLATVLGDETCVC